MTVAPPADTAPPPGASIRTLTGLAAYRCGHTGSCCRAGWPIPVEPAPLRLLLRADAHGILPVQDGSWMNDGVLGHTTDNQCVFHAPGAVSGGCLVETRLGAEALPTSCRQFPRLLLADPHGWHQSLSAWCGTTTRLLTGSDILGPPDPIEIDTFLSFDHIQADPRVHLEALDARQAWPPLLRPGVLAGIEAYQRWEHRIISDWVRPAAHGHVTCAVALTQALRWTDLSRAWRPADGALYSHFGRPWSPSRWSQSAESHAQASQRLRLVQTELMGLVPEQWRARQWPRGLTDAGYEGIAMDRGRAETAIAKYLATRLVASWLAYQGRGLRSVLASLVSSLALVALALQETATDGPVRLGHMRSAIRASDWLQLHLLDRDVWADWCSHFEAAQDATALLTVVAAAGRVIDGLPWAPAPSAPRR